jgi:predicted choloylglycine hydrolase
MTTIYSRQNIAPDYRVFDLRGSHFEMGRALGRSAPRFAIMPWWSPSSTRDFALACAAIVGEVHPPILDEYQGYADAQRIDYKGLLQGVCRTSLRQRAVGGCTSFAWRRDERVIVGRNYDFRTIQTTRLRIRLSPDAALPSVGMQGSLPGGRYDGVNAHGLFVSLHVVMADDPDRLAPGVPFHLVPRILLETCASVDAALDTITRLPHLNAFNYLLADPTRFVAVEAHPSRLRVMEPDGEFLVVANHYRHTDMIALQGRRDVSPSSRRADRVAELIRVGEEINSILSDHLAPVCEHRPHNSTLWSVMADLSARRIAYAPGTPCRISHQTVDWPARS